MNQLLIEKTRSSPAIRFDGEKHVLEIKGESFPENTAEFYAPVISWIEEYLESITDQPVIVNLEIIYANSSSTKVLMDILSMFDEAASQGKQITVNWLYDPENESALEAGDSFKEFIESVTFNLIQLES